MSASPPRRERDSRSRSPRREAPRDRSRERSRDRDRSRDRGGAGAGSGGGRGGDSNDGTNLHVGNLAFSSTEEDVHALFKKYGDVESCKLVCDPVSAQSRGFAFVKMASSRDADEAVSRLTGYDLDGRSLRVEVARRARAHQPTPGEYRGPSGASAKYGDRGGRDRGGYGDRGGRDRYGDRDRGYGDRDRDRGYGDRDRDRGYGDRDRDRGYGDRDRDRGYGDRDRDRGRDRY